MGCTNHSDGDGMVACDGNEIPRPIPSHPITIPFVMVIPSHRITTHRPDIFALGQKERCDRLCVDLNRTIPVKDLGDLK